MTDLKDDKDYSNLGEELFFSLPEKIQLAIKFKAILYLREFIFEDMMKVFPLIISKPVFCDIFSTMIVSMIRTHPNNKTKEDQDKLYDMFLDQLNKKNEELPYNTKFFGADE